MVLDPAFRERLIATFRLDLDEQLEVMTDGLLTIEKGTAGDARKAAFDSMMRAAHNIKGAARGIGMRDVGDIMHHLETLFTTLAEQDDKIAATYVDLALDCLDRARDATNAAAQEAPIDLDDTFEGLRTSIVALGGTPPERKPEAAPAGSDASGKAPEPAPSSEEVAPSGPPPVATPRKTASSSTAPAKAVPSAPAKPATSSATTDIVRVTVEKLSRLSALAEELQIAKIEIDDHVNAMHRLRKQTADLGVARQGRGGGALRTAGSLALAPVGQDPALEGLQAEIGRLFQDIRGKAGRFDIVLKALQNEMHDLRLVGAAVMTRPLERSVRDIARELGKDIDLEVHGETVEADRVVFEKLRDPIMHLIRNAIDHGIESPDTRRAAGKPAHGKVAVSIRTASGQLVVEVSDDGAGMDIDALVEIALRKKILTEDEARRVGAGDLLDMICHPGFSAKKIITDVSGRGVGMDAVRASLQSMKGTLSMRTEPGAGTTFVVRVPISLATEQALLVRAGGQIFALPITSVDRVMDIRVDDIVDIEAGEAVVVEGQAIPLRKLAAVLDLESGEWDMSDRARIPVAIVSSGWHRFAAAVEEIVGQQEMVVAPLKPPLRSVRNIAGGTFTGRRGIVMVLTPSELVETAMKRGRASRLLDEDGVGEAARAPRILVVDDSLTTRTLEKNILESHGYEVEVAVDGEDAWDRLQTSNFDLVVTDVEMPHLDGFELTERIKTNGRFRDIPVVIVTSLATEEDRRRGIEVGAEAYVVKGEFETKSLIDIVNRLV